MNFDTLFDSFNKLKVAVVGDVMLDTYMWGHVERISPEAPVPVVSLDKKEYRIGGAGNVALNTVALGAATSVLSVIGDDDEGNQLISLFRDAGINTAYIVSSPERITTSKTRIISRNQQMIRLDAEYTHDITASQEKELLAKLKELFIADKPHILVLEDYNKGILTENVITQVIALCREYNVTSAVDPKRKNFFSYKGVDIFKPNLKEVKEGLNLLFDSVDENTLQSIHGELHKLLQHKISLITLSELGVFYNAPRESGIIPTHIRKIADVSGAGDTVIAVASLLYAATGDVHLMAEVANIAGGLVCEEVGTVAVNKNKLLEECKLLLCQDTR